MLGAVLWLAIWWLFEAVPICITALLPLVLFPFLQLMQADHVAEKYMNDTVVLMLGTFILALGIERFSLHKRIALRILLFFGGNPMDPRLVLLGFCIGPAFISMWMSNSAAAVMMIPMATGVLKHLDDEDDPNKVKRDFQVAVILAITFATAIGGLATLTGCGPNLVLPGIYSGRFPDAPKVTYLKWMMFALPLALPFLIFEWLLLCWLFCPLSSVPIIESKLSRTMMEQEYLALGPMNFAEKFIAGEFAVLVVLWCTRTLGDYPGWSSFFGGLPNEGTVSVMMAIILFLVPSKMAEGQKLMDWNTCKKLPWDVVLLLGGGFALSAGIRSSGLAISIANNMEVLHVVPYLLLTPVVALIVNIMTEFSSNVATATLFLPLLAEVAISIGWHPLLLMIPATFSSNFAFILPIATPPNAIAHATGYLKSADMFIPGLILKAAGIVLLTILTPTLGSLVYDLNQPVKDLPWIKLGF
ncbi:unnamed protein product [Sphagnum jensenii]|uniref:Uncharacterized protein n=1 Tax=Sphagnum jensenii TaxID=128206 RepID=A0ABP0W975_9BRYO